MWLRWTSQQFEKLRPGIDVSMDQSSCAPKKGEPEAAPTDAVPIGIHALDLDYARMKPQIEKCQELFGKEGIQCSICFKDTPATGAGTLVCPHESCRAASHLQCLSAAFLKAEGERAKEALVPTSGCCPQCNTPLMWVDLVKDLSLRMRGEKEIKAIFKPKRAKKSAAAVDSDVDSASEDELPDIELPEDEWHELQDSSDDEREKQNGRSDPTPHVAGFKRPRMTFNSYSEPVIQDSESDEGEILR